jgi:hypothetical protein
MEADMDELDQAIRNMKINVEEKEQRLRELRAELAELENQRRDVAPVSKGLVVTCLSNLRALLQDDTANYADGADVYYRGDKCRLFMKQSFRNADIDGMMDLGVPILLRLPKTALGLVEKRMINEKSKHEKYSGFQYYIV